MDGRRSQCGPGGVRRNEDQGLMPEAGAGALEAKEVASLARMQSRRKRPQQHRNSGRGWAPIHTHWGVQKKRTKNSALAASVQVAIANKDAVAQSQSFAGARQEQEQLRCYTRRSKAHTSSLSAPAPAIPQEICGQEHSDENCKGFSCEDKCESAPPSAKSAKLIGQRSSRSRRDAPPSSLTAISTQPDTELEGGNNGSAPEPDRTGAPSCRPRRQVRANLRYSQVFFRRTDTPDYDWDVSYPGEPIPPEYVNGTGLGEVEPIDDDSSSSSPDTCDAAEPFSLKSQVATQHTRKARRIFVQDSPFACGLADVPRYVPSAPPEEHFDAPPVLHDATFLSMCPPTPEKIQESTGEWEEHRNPSIQGGSAPANDTPYEDALARHVQPSMREPSPSASQQLGIFVDLSELSQQTRTSDGFALIEEPILNVVGTLKANLVKPEKKRIRPKVKRPEKVKVAKPPKVPNIPKTSKPKNAFTRGAPQAFGYIKEPDGRRSHAKKRQRGNERVPSTLVPAGALPGMPAEAVDTMYYTRKRPGPMAGGAIYSPLLLGPATGPCPLEESVEHAGESSCPPPFLGRTSSEVSPARSAPEAEHQPLICPAIQCIPNFAGSWPEEEPPCTPRGNVLDVVAPDCDLFPPSPSFTQEAGKTSSDCEDDLTGAASNSLLRKRSDSTRRTRRTLLPMVALAAQDAPAPLCLPAPVLPPRCPFYRMSQAQKQQHARDLCQAPRYAEDPKGLVETLTRGTPVDLLPTLKSEASKLVMDVMSTNLAPRATPDQLGCRPPRATPRLINSRESAAQDQLQVVVYGPRSNGLIVFQDLRHKFKFKPRVVLDEVTVQTFERLMLHGGEATDADRADEQWAEARQQWSARAHGFNAVMHQVQGDRTFSKWGGSVLDSVVGTFLTQNVSDFLSSNAFMALRANFPVREGVQMTGSGVPAEELSSLTEEIPPIAQDQLCTGGSRELVFHAHNDHQQKSACPAPDADMQSNEMGQVVTEVSTVVAESPEAVNILVDLSSRVAAPSSFTDEEEILECSAILDKKFLHTEPTPGSQGGSCATSTLGWQVTENAENAENAETTAEVPEETSRVQGLAVETGTQAPAQDRGEKGAAGPAAKGREFAREHSVVGDKFKRSVEKHLTPESSERMLAAALRAILGKPTTARELADDQDKPPLDMVKRRQPRNHKFALVNRLKVDTRLLTGDERALYEFRLHSKSNLDQQETWNTLRANILQDIHFVKDPFFNDSVDWEAVRRADVADVALIIKERGMNNILAGRIKSLLARLHRDQDGCLDLEWIRKLAPADAQNFLTSVRGLGLKSVECIRLLSLHHPSFPVDTNVGRILVRLGWVPLEPLPEEVQLHLLEMYPVQEQIQRYIWPRLCTLDQQTLYEFHYQLITFGKVFCTKSKPNCTACPMRSQCKHFESAVSRARPLLQGPEDAHEHSRSQIAPVLSRNAMHLQEDTHRLGTIFGENVSERGGAPCIPIIEEPWSPEPLLEYEQDIEDAPCGTNMRVEVLEGVNLDVNLALEQPPSGTRLVAVTFGQHDTMYTDHVDMNDSTPTYLQNGSEEEECRLGGALECEDIMEVMPEECSTSTLPQLLGTHPASVISQELVLLPPCAASFPAPPLKSVLRLRTIHYVYELPDHHPLLVKMDKRDPEDPCFYLLAIWTPDEVPEAMPKISDDDASNPFACSQPGEEAVRGSLLVPCRSAMKGSFPLNGTYFQVNEVFADHASSLVPIDVPRTLLWNLKRRFVYFGTSVTSIFRDMSQEEIQCCFKKGYICVRAFDQATRQPKMLAARLHQSGAKIVAARAAGAHTGRPRASKSKVAAQ